MRCEEFEARLNALLDQRRHPNLDVLVSRHARLCPDCRELLAVYGIALDEVRFLDLPAADPELPRRVLDAVRLKPASPARRSLPSAVWAAVAALALVFLGRRDPPQQNVPVPPEVAINTPTASPRHESPPVPVGMLAREATARYADLARDTSGALSQVAWLLPSQNRQPGQNGQGASQVSNPSTSRWQVASLPEMAALDGSQTVAEVAAGFKPLAESTAGAVGFLLNVLPVSAPAHDPAPGAAPVDQERAI